MEIRFPPPSEKFPLAMETLSFQDAALFLL